MTKVRIEIQKLTKEKYARPHKSEFKLWFEAVVHILESHPNWKPRLSERNGYELTVRIVEQAESAKLNAMSRNISKPTNVLSFPFDPPIHELHEYLGDIAMCGEVIYKEAQQQHIEYKEYWAFLFVHSCLHLFSFSHENDEDVDEMQEAETMIMEYLGYTAISQ